MDTTTLPFAKLPISRLPLPYACVFGALVAAQSERDMGGTATEASRAIEGWFELLGMLALAEYLDTGAPDAVVNRLVFALLERRRPPLTGQWVAVARGCLRALQQPWREGRAPAWPALTSLVLGEVDDDTHPVSRLLRFRNTLCHGTFLHDEKAVLELGGLLEPQEGDFLAELIEKPISFEHPNGQVVALGEEHSAVAAAPSEFRPFTPFVQLGSDLWRVLAPALQIHAHEGEWTLVPGRLSTESSDKSSYQFESALHQLPHDGPVFTLPLLAQEAVDREELAQFVERWRATHGDVSDPVLAWLLEGEGQEPQYLSEALQVIAEQLEAATFPAAIEYALWKAAPILERSQGEDGRLAWSLSGGNAGPYAEAFGQILAGEGESA